MTAEELEKRIEEKQAQIHNIKKDIMKLKSNIVRNTHHLKLATKLSLRIKLDISKKWNYFVRLMILFIFGRPY